MRTCSPGPPLASEDFGPLPAAGLTPRQCEVLARAAHDEHNADIAPTNCRTRTGKRELAERAEKPVSASPPPRLRV